MTSPYGPLIRHNLSISDALARSGVKGGFIPDFLGQVQPVMVLADMSQTYSGEPLEGRGVGVGSLAGIPAGNRGAQYLVPRSPGGAVVEAISCVAPTGGSIYFDIFPQEDTPVGTYANIPTLSTGGIAATLEWVAGWTPAGLSGVGPFFTAVGFLPFFFNRMYVPPGAVLAIFNSNPSDGINYVSQYAQAAWREIPAPISPP